MSLYPLIELPAEAFMVTGRSCVPLLVSERCEQQVVVHLVSYGGVLLS